VAGSGTTHPQIYADYADDLKDSGPELRIPPDRWCI
jgi:hypothetical protein